MDEWDEDVVMYVPARVKEGTICATVQWAGALTKQFGAEW
jgi:hypothetical protein